MKGNWKVEHGTVTHLEKINFLQNNLLSAHTVWVDDTEVNCSANSLLDAMEIHQFTILASKSR